MRHPLSPPAAYPYAVSLVGVPVAVVGTVICAALVRYAMRLLLYADDLLERRCSVSKRTLPVMATATLGPAHGGPAESWGFWFAMPTIVLSVSCWGGES